MSGIGAVTSERGRRRSNGRQRSLKKRCMDVIGTVPHKDLVVRGADMRHARLDGQAIRGNAGDVIRLPWPAPIYREA